MDKLIRIEVAFATPELQKVVEIDISASATIKDAIYKSNINFFFPEFNLLEMPVGVFGKRIFEPESYQIKEGDRIEVYRPLNKTPNQKRLERAKNN